MAAVTRSAVDSIPAVHDIPSQIIDKWSKMADVRGHQAECEEQGGNLASAHTDSEFRFLRSKRAVN